MKAQILKQTGLTEKQFYAKYKNPEDFENSKEGKAFFKAHPEARSIKKAKLGTYIGGDTAKAPKLINYQDIYDDLDKQLTGSTEQERLDAAAKQAQIAAASKSSGGGGGFDMSSMMSMFGGGEGGAKYGKRVPKAQVGTDVNGNGIPDYLENSQAASQQTYAGPQRQPVQAVGSNLQPAGLASLPQQQPSAALPTAQQLQGSQGGDAVGGALKALPLIGPVAGAIEAFANQKKAKGSAEQAMLLSGLALDLSRMKRDQTERKYNTPWDNPVQPGQLYRPGGGGTNVLTRNGGAVRKAQDGTIETPQIDGAPTDWYEEGMDKDTYYGFKKQLEDAGYKSIPKPETINVRDMQAITEEQPDPNQMSEEQAASFMEMYNRDQGKSTATFDSKSARDNWVQKTGLPWSEAKRLGYTSGSAKDNNKLLAELNDPRFKKENLRTEAPKKSSQARTPVQHRETPTGKLAPIKKPLTLDEYFKGKPKYTKNQGEIQMPDEGTMIDRLGERLANPGQTLASLAKYGELPAKGFSKNDKNAYDQVLGVANPFYWANALGNASDYAEQGEYKKAAIEAADALPALGKLKYTKYLPFNKGLPPASVRRAGYLGEGAKRLGQRGAKRLGYEDGGEIQNTYAPDYLYDDLGYEPLNDSNVKQYYHGGGIPKAAGGFSSFMSAGGGDLLGGMASQGFNNSAGYQAGSAIGGFSDFIVPGSSEIVAPVLGTIGGALDQAFGDAGKIKKFQEKAKRNTESAAMNNMGQGIQAGNAPHMEEGGWVSHDWQPQVISSFGGLNEQEVYDYAHDGMESLRAGGHIRGEYQPISNRGMQTYDDGGEVKTSALNGEIQTTWGGGVKTLSHNPYMPASGKTFKFVGNSHNTSDGNGNTGIGVKYGKGNHDSYTDYAEYGTQQADADVEVEVEPAAELIDPKTGEKNLTIWGDLSTNMFVDILGKEAKNKKFKTLVEKDWTKQEIKGNNLVNQAAEIANKKNANPLDFSTAQALDFAGKSILKNIAQKKIDAANLQNSINETAEENGLVASDLARGKVKFDKEALKEYAEYGKTIKKAKDGDKIKGDKMTVKEALAKGYKLEADGKYHLRTKSEDIPEKETKVGEAMAEIPKGQKQSASGTWGKVTPEQYQQFVKDNSSWFDFSNFDPKNKDDVKYFQRRFNEEAAKTGSTAKITPDGALGEQTVTARIKAAKQKDPSVATDKIADIYEEDKVYDVNAKKRNPWVDAIGQILPFIRPSDQEAFDQSQIYPEISSIVNNQLEPVQAQGYQPDLGTPYDISLQDQLNANQADFNSIQRLYANNPFALAQFAAQKYAANEKVLGDQFRLNQAERSRVYDKNRDILNDAKLKNLDIFDRQYVRQAQAKSNTKAVAQAALNSITDKYAKNKLENRELGIYENLYNYRYSPSGRAINMNAPWQANLPNMYDKGNRTANMREVYDKQGNFLRYEPIEETTTTTDETLDAAGRTPGTVAKKNGGKVKAKNGSIVSAYKNL